MSSEPGSAMLKFRVGRVSPPKHCRSVIAIGLMSLSIAIPSLAVAGQLAFSMALVTADGSGKSIGRVTVEASPHGAILVPALSGLPPGLHGFHLHESADCSPALKEGKKTAAAAAGGHYDPDDTGKHDTPWGDGHRGDLPALFVDAYGKAEHPVLAPRLKVSEVGTLALMIHAGSDNYDDHPEPLGGGGSRIACGVAAQMKK